MEGRPCLTEERNGADSQRGAEGEGLLHDEPCPLEPQGSCPFHGSQSAGAAAPVTQSPLRKTDAASLALLEKVRLGKCFLKGGVGALGSQRPKLPFSLSSHCVQCGFQRL